MIREVKCKHCETTIQYDDKDLLLEDANDITTTLHHSDGSTLESHMKYVVCPQCAGDVDVGALEIRYNLGKKCSMEIIYYGKEAMV